MGRRKILIQQITDPKLRNITYNKRKNGLIKKAAEISLLCGINLMLVFEDLNGTLVQFSRNKLKSIGSFPNECTYKRVLELTAEDYPNFSSIKRHKKNQENSEEKKFLVPELTGKKGARCLEEMISEDESSMTREEEIFSSDNDAISGYTTSLNIVIESPETNFSEKSSPAEPQFQPDQVKKVIKTTATTQVSAPVRSPNLKTVKNRPILHLNISKPDDTHKEVTKEKQNKEAANSTTQLNAQKPDTMMPPMPLGGLETQNHQLNIVNLLDSPYKQDMNQRRLTNFPVLNNTEDRFGSHFADVSPFTLHTIGLTPLPMKQTSLEGEDDFSNDKILNYLSHPGRSPPQQQGVFTFQQNEPAFGMDNEQLLSAKKTENAFWELLYNGKESCEKIAAGLASAARSEYKFNFEGYSFGNYDRFKN